LNGSTLEMGEDEVLCAILNEIIARAEPDVAEAICLCAIPHWFNEEIIAWLRGEGLKPSRRSREILAALTELIFVDPYYERGWAYHENVRGLLLRRWRERGGAGFRELSGWAAGYFTHKLGEKEALLARLFAAGQRVWGEVETPTEYEREEYQRELMYHLLAADPGQGSKLFRRMFRRAHRFRQFGICALLLQLAGEQVAHLSADDLLWLRFHQGQLAQASAQWPEALMTFEGLWREELLLSLEGTLTKDLGLLYQAKGEWDRAIAYYKRSLALKEKVGDEYGMAPTFHDLGLVYQYKGNLDKAIECHERSLAIVEKIGDEYGMSCIFNSLGGVYQAKGEWERAIECYERNLAIHEKVGDEHEMVGTLNNLANVYQARGEWERAIECYECSLAIREKVGDEHEMVGTLNNLANVYQAKGEWERAIECYERSLAIREKVGDEHEMAFSYNNMADLHQDQGRLQEAVPLFKKSVEIFERIGDEYHTKIGRKNLAKAKQELEAKKEQI
jgi:tetratricopeptide (TPR) repeat protein